MANALKQQGINKIILLSHAGSEKNIEIAQKVNDIDKAQARTLYKLSKVLGCSIEDLLENPEL